ncbi:MAG: tRNA (cytidine(34)-2'-O)-methyltransferase [Deltaproteobacteria bacterium]|jgi:tRNA (cytidine/uridine-2'-O-)-methyltransferase|nr:tRNA (cytidine(34)-2'-O)-methyltransferase [Deltaproteobacteria bacterium]
MDIILYHPEIPPNAGNVARLCAGFSLPLHLISPLGFSLSDRYLKRAGLDYWPYVNVRAWPDWETFRESRGVGRLIGTSARSGASFAEYEPRANDGLVFGPESTGLSPEFLATLSETYSVPLRAEVRSLNLATTVGFFLGYVFSRLGPL